MKSKHPEENGFVASYRNKSNIHGFDIASSSSSKEIAEIEDAIVKEIVTRMKVDISFYDKVLELMTIKSL